MANYDYNKITSKQHNGNPKEVYSGLSQIESDNEELMEESALTTTVNVEEVTFEPEETNKEIEEPEEIEEQSSEQQPAEATKIGMVDGCDKLNVRQYPSSDANVVGQPLNKGAKVVIDEANSADDFYKIYQSTGLEGYCMKAFIKIAS